MIACGTTASSFLCDLSPVHCAEKLKARCLIKCVTNCVSTPSIVKVQLIVSNAVGNNLPLKRDYLKEFQSSILNFN